MQEDSVAGRFERSEEQIYKEVLGNALGFNKNLAFCPSQHHDANVILEETIKLRRKVEE